MALMAESPNAGTEELNAVEEREEDSYGRSRLVAFVNTASGGRNGSPFLVFMSRFLGADFVFDLKEDKGAEKGLLYHDEIRAPGEVIRVLACGGDGTFSWVAGCISKLQMKDVVLLPVALGSGNDMSRALGWGHKYPGTTRFARLLEYVEKSSTMPLDVWGYTVRGEDPALNDVENAEGSKPVMRYFCNYISLGVDAQVELCFNEARWENPDKFKSRIGNIAWHAVYGAKLQLHDKKIHRIEDYVSAIEIDGKTLELPMNVQALLILNIPSYGAGASPWGKIKNEQEWMPSMVDDNLLEVVALTNLKHFVRVKAGGAHALRLAQGRSITVHLKKSEEQIPLQADGEPWRQESGRVIEVDLARTIETVLGPHHRQKLKNHAKFRLLYPSQASTEDL